MPSRKEARLEEAASLLSRAISRVNKLNRGRLRYSYLDAISSLIYDGDLRAAAGHAYNAWRALVALLAARLIAPRILAEASARPGGAEEAYWWGKRGLRASPEDMDTVVPMLAEALRRDDPAAASRLLKALILSEKVRLYSHYGLEPEAIGYANVEDFESDLIEFLEILRWLAGKYYRIPLPPP